MLPPGLCVLWAIVAIKKDKEECETVFLALLYPLWVPAESIYHAARELFWGEDREEGLTAMKALKMFEHLG